MDPITDGMQITYCKEDSGQIIPGKIWLVPGEVLTVGKDLPADFATRLVEDNVCRVLDTGEGEDAPKHDPATPPEPTVALRETGQQAPPMEIVHAETAEPELKSQEPDSDAEAAQDDHTHEEAIH